VKGHELAQIVPICVIRIVCYDMYCFEHDALRMF